MWSFWNDVRYAARRLAASPGFTIVAILTIGLGIGINTGIFSILDGLVFRDMPAPNAGRLLSIHERVEGAPNRITSGTDSFFSTSEYRKYRDESKTLDGIAGFRTPSMIALGTETRRAVTGAAVTCSYFDVLGVTPVLGTGFAPRQCGDTASGAVVVIGHDLWASSFAADPEVIGRTVTLNGQTFTIIGVTPEGFSGVSVLKSQLFVPITAQPLLDPSRSYVDDDNIGWLELVGLRNESASVDQVRAELGVIASQIDLQQPGRSTRLMITRATPLTAPALRLPALAASAVVLAGFVLVLVIACTNVANLLIARGDSRMREIAIRQSLGATRTRLIRQVLSESLLIAVCGGLLGATLSLWTFKGLVTVALSVLPQAARPLVQINPVLDIRVLAFALLATLGTGIVVGLAPALKLSKPDLRRAIESDTAGSGRRERGRLQGLLVGTQVAVSMVLVISTALLLRGLYAAQTVDPGFDYRNLIVASADLRGFGYQPAQSAAFQRELMERVGALPGVETVAQALITPLETRNRGMGVRLPEREQNYSVSINTVSSNYFSVLGIPIVRGRTFTSEEIASANTTAVIVTESTARRFWPGQDPVGKALNLLALGGVTFPATVVGVAQDANVQSLASTDQSFIYTPAIEATQTGLQLVIQTAIGTDQIAQSVRSIVAELDPGLIVNVAPLEENLGFWRRLSRFVAGLSSALGALALLLASIGIYGVISFVVSRRLREIGIRVALGARPRDVIDLVVRSCLRPVVIGALIGIAACFGVSRLLSSLLFGVSSLDPLAMIGGTVLVLAIALLAALAPARRAMRVDPMTSLRYE